jgi:hypothetical protein
MSKTTKNGCYMHRKFMVMQSVTWSLNTTRENLLQIMQSLCQWLIYYITITSDTIHLIYTMFRWLYLLLFSDYWAIYFRWYKLNTFTPRSQLHTILQCFQSLARMLVLIRTKQRIFQAICTNQNITATQPRIHPKLIYIYIWTETSPDYSLDTLVRW